MSKERTKRTITEIAEMTSKRVLEMVKKRKLIEQEKRERRKHKLEHTLKKTKLAGSVDGATAAKKVVHAVMQDIYTTPSETKKAGTIYLSLAGKAMLLQVIETMQYQMGIRLTEEQALQFAAYSFLPSDETHLSEELKNAFRVLRRGRSFECKIGYYDEFSDMLAYKSFQLQTTPSILMEYAVHQCAAYVCDGDVIDVVEDAYSDHATKLFHKYRKERDLSIMLPEDILVEQMSGGWSEGHFHGVRKFKTAIERYKNNLPPEHYPEAEED